MAQEGVPVGVADLRRQRDDVGRRGGAQALGHAEGVHAVQEVAPHQAIPSPTIDREAGAAGHDHPELLAVGIDIEEALEKTLPSAVLVDLVKDHLGAARPGLVGADGLGGGVGPLLDQAPVVGVVPVQVGVGAMAADRGLAHLAGAADEGHLAMLPKMGL